MSCIHRLCQPPPTYPIQMLQSGKIRIHKTTQKPRIQKPSSSAQISRAQNLVLLRRESEFSISIFEFPLLLAAKFYNIFVCVYARCVLHGLSNIPPEPNISQYVLKERNCTGRICVISFRPESSNNVHGNDPFGKSK